MSGKKPLTDEQKADLMAKIRKLNPDSIAQTNDETQKQMLKYLMEMREKMNPYSQIMRGVEDKDEYLMLGLTQLGRDWIVRETCTAFIAYLCRMRDEYKVPENVPVISVHDFIKDPTLADPPKAADEKLGLPADMEKNYLENKENMLERVVIGQFLERVFQFDPARHVKIAYKPNAKDTERHPVVSPQAEIGLQLEYNRLRAAKKSVKQQQELAEAEADLKFVQEAAKEAKVSEPRNTKVKVPCRIAGQNNTNIAVYREILTTASEAKKLASANYGDLNNPAVVAKLPLAHAVVDSEHHLLLLEKRAILAERNIDTSQKKDKVFDDIAKSHTVDNAESVKPKRDPLEFLKWQSAVCDTALSENVRALIPPTELFSKFLTYWDRHYEQIRRATTDLYCEKPDMELAINPYEFVTGKKGVKAFKEKHQRDVGLQLFSISRNKWNLLGPFADNRDKVEFYGSAAGIAEEMFKARRRDQEQAKDLLSKTSKRKKREIKGSGVTPADKKNFDHAQLKQFGLDELNSGEADCEDDEVEVEVFQVLNGGRDMVKGKVFLEAEAPSESHIVYK